MKMSITEAVYATAKGLHKAKVISDKRMKEYEAMCKKHSYKALKLLRRRTPIFDIAELTELSEKEIEELR